MITAIDTNVLIALWDRDHALNSIAQSSLEAAFRRGSLVVPAPVYTELMANPGRSEAFLDSFFRDTGITVDWNLEEAVWRAAGLAFQHCLARRRKQRDSGPRRILVDFLIGAYANQRQYRLLTLDDLFYRTSFPDLAIVKV